MTPKAIKNLTEPFTLHVKGIDKWPYLTRLYWGLMLIFGARIKYYFCNSLRASFNDTKEKEFLGLEYMGSRAWVALGDTDDKEIEVEKLDQVTHLVIDKTIKHEG